MTTNASPDSRGDSDMTVISPDPDELVSSSQVAGLLNEFFDLDGEDLIQQNTPHMWWYRSKQNRLAYPMPKPDVTVGRQKAPVWKQAKLLHWFGQWQEIEVPWCSEAGDKTDHRAKDIPSEYRR